jgi:ribosomal protein L11 methyltransferase
MENLYYEVIFSPSDHIELFENFLIEETGEGIERADNTIILRSLNNPDLLIETIYQYTKNLSEIFQDNITCTVVSSKKKNEDWVESYKQGFTPFTLDGFHIRASWHEEQANLINIVIDPELVFGTGHHATTQVALRALKCYLKPQMSMVDVGAGSGILAIAGAKLGADVSLCDIDPTAVSDAAKNFDINGVKYIENWEGSLHKSGAKSYNLIVANIVADVLLSLKGQFYNYLEDNGTLIVSGILDKHLERVREAYSKFKEIEHFNIDEWHALVFEKKRNNETV